MFLTHRNNSNGFCFEVEVNVNWSGDLYANCVCSKICCYRRIGICNVAIGKIIMTDLCVASLPRLRGIVEHIGDLGIEVHENDVLKESVQTDENDTADNNADDDLDCGIDIAFAGLGREGGLGTNGKLGYLGIDLVNEFLHIFITSFFR